MWQKEAFLIELKKRAIYAYDFWLKMLIPPLVQIVVAYYLWDAIFSNSSASTIGGYSFQQMMIYYIVASSLYQAVQPEVGIVIRDIYDGTLTKYLFYPLSFFQFKFLAHLSQMFLMLIQFAVVASVFGLIFGWPTPISVPVIVGGFAATIVAGYLYFMFAAMLELLGFWVEQVWGLVIMLQFVTNLLGGKLIPLSVFPHWIRALIDWTPFPAMVSFPTRVFLGEVGPAQFIMGLSSGIVWSILMTVASMLIWKRGSYQFTGTGM